MGAQRLGQHFLRERRFLERIAQAACRAGEPLAVEIGPGRGALTGFLLARAERVVAIEVDSALVAGLREKFAGETRLTLVGADVLRTDLGQWGPAVVAGNLPYYITSAILRKILDLGPLLGQAVLLVQREVAQRLTARPGTRDYGYLTVETNLSAIAEILFSVPPSAFWPPPKVHSAVVRVAPRPQHDPWVLQDRAPFLEFVGQCFRHKRKTLRNNLVGIYGPAVEEWPESGQRAEQLSIDQFISLYQRLAADP